jgi:hypothetical protein
LYWRKKLTLIYIYINRLFYILYFLFLGCSQVVPELVTVQRDKLRLCRWQQLLASWASTPSVTHAPTPADTGPANINKFDNCFRGHPSSQTAWPCVKKEVQLQITNCRSRDNRSRSVPKHAPAAQCSTALQKSTCSEADEVGCSTQHAADGASTPTPPYRKPQQTPTNHRLPRQRWAGSSSTATTLPHAGLRACCTAAGGAAVTAAFRPRRSLQLLLLLFCCHVCKCHLKLPCPLPLPQRLAACHPQPPEAAAGLQ